MAVVQPPNQLQELDHVDEILLQELERVDEILLEELERMDEMLLRIVAAIDQLPERIASASRRELGPVAGNGARAAEPVRGRASTRPFDPYGEDEVEPAEEKKSAARQVAGKVQSWVAAYAPDRGALRFATVSLAVAWLATTIAVVALIAAVLR
jgi:predicted NACHT family NTPase